MFFPDFPYSAHELSAFSFSFETFSVSLKTGEIVHFEAPEPKVFRLWLRENGVRDISGKPLD
ncbi:MAG: hypothetical protein JST52_01190 [Bacteroidetes bacterium]|nr:hypothetical protein [Bacteroidota bacterium]MBS1739200.1 hypothetical protein [Bacteroidota bacterium]